MIDFSDLYFAPLVASEILIALLILSVFILIFSLWRGGKGSLFRGIILGILLTLLASPSIISETRRYLNDTVLLVIDETDSQKYHGRTEQKEEAVQAVIRQLEQFKNVDLQTIIVRSPPAGETAQEEGTRLFKARDTLLKSIPASRVAATILVTDGQVHDVPSLQSPSQKAAGPVHALLTGRENEKDRVLFVETAPSFGIVGKDVTVTVKVIDREKKPTPKTVAVTIKLDGTVVQRVALRTGIATDIRLAIPHGGANFIEIASPEWEGELSKRNNIAFLTVNGIRDRLKVLLVSGEPHMGERGWRNILKSDPSVELVHFTILRPPEKQDGTPINELSLIPFPIAELFERKLEEFDLVIFDRYRRRGVLAPNYLNNIVSYVRNGGALLEAAGPAFATPLSLYRTPLADILPGRPTGVVFEQGYVPALNDNGKKHPVTALLPSGTGSDRWGRWFRMIDTDLGSGTVLMTGPDDRPLLVLERQGEGRVAQLLSDHAWLWGHGFEGGGPQGELLRRLAHWLMKEPELEEESLTGRAVGAQMIIERRTLSPDIGPVTLEDPDGEKTSLTLESSKGGLKSGSLPLNGQGLYTLTSGTLKTLVAVGRLNPLESRDIRSSTQLLAPILKETGGGLVRLDTNPAPGFRRTAPDSRQASKNWLGLRDNKNFEITGFTKTSLMPPILALLLLLGALCLAWWRESR